MWNIPFLENTEEYGHLVPLYPHLSHKIACLFLTTDIISSAPDRRLAADSHCARSGGIIYKAGLHERSGRLWNSFACLPPTLTFTLLRTPRLEGCFAFHSSRRPFTTITFAVINFAAVHTDRCNCYARRAAAAPQTTNTWSVRVDVSVFARRESRFAFSNLLKNKNVKK